jgi:hypothetical protein
MAVPSMDERALGPRTGAKYLYTSSLVSALVEASLHGITVKPMEDILSRKYKKDCIVHNPA